MLLLFAPTGKRHGASSIFLQLLCLICRRELAKMGTGVQVTLSRQRHECPGRTWIVLHMRCKKGRVATLETCTCSMPAEQLTTPLLTDKALAILASCNSECLILALSLCSARSLMVGPQVSKRRVQDLGDPMLPRPTRHMRHKHHHITC